MELKYELTEETNLCGFYRIRALRSFGNVKDGDLGGFIESEDNLSHLGNCWVYDDAVVCNKARIFEDAKVYGDAIVHCNATISGRAEVYGNAKVCGEAEVYDNANVRGDAYVGGHSQVFGDARVYGETFILDNAKVSGNVSIYGQAIIIGGDAIINESKDYVVFKNWWGSGRYFTWTRSNNMWRAGCFQGTGEELIKRAYDEDKEKGKQYENIVKYVEFCVLSDNSLKDVVLK